MIVMGMGGIYRGLIREATLLIDNIGADLWVVQGSTRGPFAEISRVPANLEDRARAVPGVADARRFVSHTVNANIAGSRCASSCKACPGRRIAAIGFRSSLAGRCARRTMR